MAAARDRLARLGRPRKFAWCGFNLAAYIMLPARRAARADSRPRYEHPGGGLRIGQPEIHPLAEGEPPRIRPVTGYRRSSGIELFFDLVARTLAH